MAASSKAIGKMGEAMACKYLQQQGYTILEKNYAAQYGEIDIIAMEGDTVAFIEVKTRKSGSRFGIPAEAVNRRKQRKIVLTALTYIEQKKLFNRMSRFDVVEVLLCEGTENGYDVNLIKDAFGYSGKYGY